METLQLQFSKVSRAVSIDSFQKFKKAIIALKKYSTRRVINPGVLVDYHVSLVDPKTILVEFECNEEILDLFNQTIA